MRRASSPPQEDQIFETLILIVVLLILLFLIFTSLFEEAIMKALFSLRMAEIKGLALLNPDFESLRRSLLKLKLIDDPLLTSLSGLVNHTLRVPVVFILALLSVWSFRASPTRLHSKVLNLSSFMKKMGRFWPACVPILKSPVRLSPRDPAPGSALWREAATPEEWARERNLKKEATTPEQIEKELLKDLGPPWRGIEFLEDDQKALLTLFLSSAYLDKQTLQDLKLEIAHCWGPKGGFKISASLRGFIKKMHQTPAFQKDLHYICERHGYVGTVLMAALAQGRSKIGVLPTADFLWLRCVSRPLWYGLNNLGRRTFHTEALALMSHYQEELRSGQKSEAPRLKRAVKALLQELHTNLYSKETSHV